MRGRPTGWCARTGLSFRLSVAAVVAAISFGGAAPAEAAFPGQNGKIAYSCQGVICTANPDSTGRSYLVTAVSGHDAAWSADGTVLAFTSGFTSAAEIYVVRADGTGLTALTSNQAEDGNPAWSPRGDRIVFASDRGQTSPCAEFYNFACDFDLYVMNADGSGPVRLTNNNTRDSDPSWHPDGSRIAYACGSHVCLINPDGTGVTDLGPGDYPNWSPDGVRLAASGFQVVTMNTDGTNQTPVTSSFPGHEAFYQPAWAPDGTKIAFTWRPPCLTPQSCAVFPQLGTINPDGSGFFEFQAPAPGESQPDWQPLPLSEPSPADFKNASKFCKAERERLGAAEFARRYATNGANAHGKCVSANSGGK